MTMSAEKPFGWIKQVERLLYELEEKPQFGVPSSFSLQRFEKRLQEIFDRPSLKVTYSLKGWVASEQIREGAGEVLLPLKLEWAPLASPAYFITTDQDLKLLMADLLGGEKEAAYFYDPSLVQGFYHYFACEMLHALQQQEFAPSLSPHLSERGGEIQEMVGTEPCFLIDVTLSLNGNTFWGRILLPESFRRDWKSYFSNLPPPSLSQELLEKITVDVGLELGHVRLNFSDWKSVRKGDFILLDHCSYDPDTGKGGVVLTLEQRPLFRGRFKENGIKLTEYPIYEEVMHPMEEHRYESEEEGDEEHLYGDELPEEEGFEFEEEEERREVEVTHAEPAISPEELPINLTVEVGRLRLTAQELMNLAPGNLLEVNVAPEQGVDLVVNGKKVGRGELIRLGETLGVRILSL